MSLKTVAGAMVSSIPGMLSGHSDRDGGETQMPPELVAGSIPIVTTVTSIPEMLSGHSEKAGGETQMSPESVDVDVHILAGEFLISGPGYTKKVKLNINYKDDQPKERVSIFEGVIGIILMIYGFLLMRFIMKGKKDD